MTLKGVEKLRVGSFQMSFTHYTTLFAVHCLLQAGKTAHSDFVCAIHFRYITLHKMCKKIE